MFLKKSISLITILSLILLSVPFNVVEASNYSFTQTSWAGGDGTGSNIVHGFSANRTKYDDASADLDLTTPTQLRLKTTSSSVTQTTNTDFNLGAFFQTATSSNSVVLNAPGGVFSPVSFPHTGTQQTWVVPTGVTSITVDIAGAKGGNGYYGAGGNGGRATTTLTVTPGNTLYIYVGGQGLGVSPYTGGWNGGGTGDGNGGGGSDIRSGGTALTNRVVVAAGGGDSSGGGGAANGGGGGGSSYTPDNCTSPTVCPSNYQDSDGYVNISYTQYYSTGTFTSNIISVGGNTSYGNLDWDQTLNGGSITMKARSCNDAACSGEPAISTCGDISKNTSLKSGSPNCVNDGDQWIQYQATLNSISPYTATPSLDEVRLGYNYYATNQTLTSLPFNSASKRDAVAKINVKGTLGASGTAMKVQARSAASEAGLTSAQWCGSTSCNGTDVFNFTSPNADPGQTLNVSDSHPLKNGGDDQWFQYKVVLQTTDGLATPTFSDIYIGYNADVSKIMAKFRNFIRAFGTIKIR